MLSNNITFNADDIQIAERKSDNSYKVTFFVGEYEREKIAQLFLLPKEVNLKINVAIIE